MAAGRKVRKRSGVKRSRPSRSAATASRVHGAHYARNAASLAATGEVYDTAGMVWRDGAWHYRR